MKKPTWRTNLSHFMSLTAAFTISVSATTSQAKRIYTDVWSKQQVKEMRDLSKGVSQDLKQFFNDNPDWFADTYGGTAYDRKEMVRTFITKFFVNVEKAMSFYVEKFNLPFNAKPVDGMDNLCTSPRICLGLQYVVGKSILEQSSSDSQLNFYVASNDDGKHNYILIMPKGAQPNDQNIHDLGIIFDPYPKQNADPDTFIHLGSEREYQGTEITGPLSDIGLESVFGKDPFNTNPTPDPEPTPDPNPTPDPAPICITGSGMTGWDIIIAYKKDANGNIFLPLAQQMYDSCYYQPNKQAILDGYRIYLNAQPQFDCIGVYNIPAGTDFPPNFPSTLPTSGYTDVFCR